MKKNKNIFVLGISLITFFSTCKKFPEDKFAFRTVKARIEAEWQIEKIEINGEDVSYKFNDSLAPLSLSCFYFWFIYKKLAPNPNNNEMRDLFLINKSSKSYKDAYNNNDVSIGHFGYEEKKKYLILSLNENQTNDTLSVKIFKKLLERHNYTERYSIQSLYHKQLIIQTIRNNNIYRIYFNRTQQ